MPNFLWGSERLHPKVREFTVGNDRVLDMSILPYDVLASIAWAKALQKAHMLTGAEYVKLTAGLKQILELLEQGKFKIKRHQEDCHTAIEEFLIGYCGAAGKKIHTGRSRNDQVLVAIRLFTKARLKNISRTVIELEKVLLRLAKKYEFYPQPGHSHTRLAMPSSVGHKMAGFLEMLQHNHRLLAAAYVQNDENPLGAGAGYGSMIPVDRELITRLLGFSRTANNSLYCMGSRGQVEGEVLGSLAEIMITLSRLATEMTLFTAPEYNYYTLPAEFTTGSSRMPQKRNPDVCEVMHAKAKEVMNLQNLVRAICVDLSLEYNRDVQLTKGPLIEGLIITEQSLQVAALVMSRIIPNKVFMLAELFATQEADRLALQGVPFRDAHHRIKAGLREVREMDPVAAIRELITLGAPGNLRLGDYRIDKPL